MEAVYKKANIDLAFNTNAVQAFINHLNHLVTAKEETESICCIVQFELVYLGTLRSLEQLQNFEALL